VLGYWLDMVCMHPCIVWCFIQKYMVIKGRVASTREHVIKTIGYPLLTPMLYTGQLVPQNFPI
jgi:hypothetical protein